MASCDLRLALCAGLVSLIALGAAACGDDDDDGNATGGKGGSSGLGGGSGSGGSAGSAAGAGGTAGVAGGLQCGAQVCPGFATLDACCAGEAQDRCGAAIAGITGLPDGCYATNQPGNVECACPSSPEIEHPGAPGEKLVFPGCCRAGIKQCGYMIDVGDGLGAKLGCIAPWDNAAPASCTSGPNKPCPQDAGVETGADGADGGETDGGDDASTD
jgi:hypothetical protein